MRSESSSLLFEQPSRLILEVCKRAGSHDLIADLTRALRRDGIVSAIQQHDDSALYDWLLKTVSFQGISDVAAATYMSRHGAVRYADIRSVVRPRDKCSKLHSFSNFEDCGFEKSAHRCSNPSRFRRCLLPKLDLRNGRLNQTAASLYLFMRDVCGGDFVGWVNDKVVANDASTAGTVLTHEVSQVFGLGEKVSMLALSSFLIAGSTIRPRWLDVGVGMIVVDTLVHNFLERTGILRHAGAEHAYGLQCQGEDGCRALIRELARSIDASEFNTSYPRYFPRFVQQAIWRYCADLELGICNGNRINDRIGCMQSDCAVFEQCSRLPLASAQRAQKSAENDKLDMVL